MGDNIMLSTPEDEEDLESLRLAALQSLKRKSQQQQQLNDFNNPHYQYQNHFNNGSPRGKHNNKSRGGKFFRPMMPNNRLPRNGQQTPWTRNTNLISVPMIPSEGDTITKPEPPSEAPKLILPQDRYCKKLKEEEQESTSSPVSKFDRYNDSDESEDDDDSDEPSSQSRSSNKSPLKRSDSLEALMAELESEITGDAPKPKELNKPNKQKKLRKGISVEIDSEKTPVEAPIVIEPPVKVTAPVIEERKPKPVAVNKPVPNNDSYKRRKWQLGRPRQFFPPPHHQDFVQQPPPMPPQFAPPPPQLVAPPMNVYPFVQYRPPPPPMRYDQPPPHFSEPPPQRPLSPLSVKTDAFGAPPSMGALSPRSAAFVLQNRAIIEKRKRRSYSRSPSPRFRRSLTPPPKRRSLSPVRKVLPPVRQVESPPPRKPIHDRLGTKGPQRSPPEKAPVSKRPEKQADDPVLEARRRKFESNEIKVKEGVIRLKTKEEEAPAVKKADKVEIDDGDDDLLLDLIDDAIDLDPKIDMLSSDEESNSDNEGRFKTKAENAVKIPILPFSKLINGAKSEVKSDLRADDRRRERGRDSGGRNNGNDRDRRRRSRSPVKRIVIKPSNKKVESSSAKSSSKQANFPVDSNKKIEIKIRNPGKYEKGEDKEKAPSSVGRKVELSSKKLEVLDVEEAELKIEEIPDDSANVNEGDLRAQLSRKRAERQKHPPAEVPPTRILQNALKGVGFKKSRKTAKTVKKEIDDGNVKDGRLPIHLRLGQVSPEVSTSSSAAVSTSPGRKRKKRGNNQEQV